MGKQRRVRQLAMTAGVLLSGGCMLSSPYVKLADGGAAEDFCTDQSCSIDAAIAYSRAVRGAYRTVLDRYSRLRSDSGATSIGLGAAALGAAAGGAHKDVLTSIGLLGATTFGYATWYGNPPREALFMQTIEALVCAEGITNKLRLPLATRAQSQALLAEGRDLVKAIEEHASKVANARTALNAEHADLVAEQSSRQTRITSLGSQTPRPDAKIARLQGELDALTALIGVVAGELDVSTQLLTEVDSLVEAFENATVAYLVREHSADLAGYNLVSTVDRIVTRTDAQAQQTLPDPNSAFAIVAGLGAVAAQLLPSAASVTTLRTQASVGTAKISGGGGSVAGILAARPTVSALVDALAAHRFHLSGALVRLQAVTQSLNALAAPPVLDSSADSVDRCTLAGIGGLVASPSTLKFAPGKAAHIPVDLRGGKPPYSVEFGGVTPAGVSLTAPGFGGSRFVVVATTATVAGNTMVKVIDGSGRILEIPLAIAVP